MHTSIYNEILLNQRLGKYKDHSAENKIIKNVVKENMTPDFQLLQSQVLNLQSHS